MQRQQLEWNDGEDSLQTIHLRRNFDRLVRVRLRLRVAHVRYHYRVALRTNNTSRRGWRRGSVVRASISDWRTFPDLCLRGSGVRYGSTNQANSAFHPFGVGK